MRSNAMDSIHYLVVYQPVPGHVPASVFFMDDGEGTVHGLYFGDAGGGTSDEAYFRMEISAGSAERFLECDSAEDPRFRVDRARDRRRRLPPLSATDAAAFAALCRCRRTWWSFGDGDEVRMSAARVEAMKPMDGMLCTHSDDLDTDVLALIRRHWSLSY
jgi:hypothetical protein